MSKVYTGLDVSLVDKETEAEKLEKVLDIVSDNVLHQLKTVYVICRREEDLIADLKMSVDQLNDSVKDAGLVIDVDEDGFDSSVSIDAHLEELRLTNLDIAEIVIQLAGYVEAKKPVRFLDSTGRKMKKGVH